MGEYIVSIAGTEAGATLAFVLIMLSAVAHAVFGAINKGGADPFLNRGAINVFYGLGAAPFALIILPWPSAQLWPVIALSYVVHLVYEWLQSTAFQRGAFTVVYPIARGTSPLATVGVGALIFPDALGMVDLIGVVLLCAAIYAFALANLRDRGAPRRDELLPAIISALGAGVMVAAYTLVDTYGVRLAADPFIFLAWFFMLGGLGFPFISLWRWRSMTPADRPRLSALALRGFVGAIVAYFSFGFLLLATRLGNIGELAALRETSIVFGAAIGVFIFRERIDALRIGLICAIVAAALLIKLG